VSRAVLSLGSNLGDRLGALRSAVAGLGTLVVAVSPVYETRPWGPVPQEDYLNAVVVAEDPGAGARSWLATAARLEEAAGRQRSRRWGPRTLDVDVVTVTGGRPARPVLSLDPDLTLPHPRAHERAFVLVPWLAVEPGAVLPGRGSVAGLLAGLDPLERAGVRTRPDLRLERVPR